MANYIIIKEKSQYYHKLNIIGDLRKNRIPILVVPKTIQKTVHAFSSLDSIYITRRSAPFLALRRPTNSEEYVSWKRKRKRGRFWNRAQTGIDLVNKFERQSKWGWKFLTLTSSYASDDMSRDWEVFKKRLLMAYKLKDLIYIKVKEYNEKENLYHLHALIYSPYLPQDWIKEQWNDIHKAYIVWIEEVKESGLRETMGYMCSYISKAMIGRFSYSKSWLAGLRRLPVLWHAVICFRFKYFTDQGWEWIYSIWSEFLSLLKAGKVGAGIGDLYDFMVVSTW